MTKMQNKDIDWTLVQIILSDFNIEGNPYPQDKSGFLHHCTTENAIYFFEGYKVKFIEFEEKYLPKEMQKYYVTSGICPNCFDDFMKSHREKVKSGYYNRE